VRRFAAVVLTVAIAAVGAVGPTGAAHADDDDPNVDNFSFSSFDATYELSRADDGTSRLRTVETLVAEFPENDQNHGIRRELVDDYDGHPTNIDVESVTDENGTARDFDTETDDEFLVVTIADDDFVHGAQTYVITYTQSNVTRFFADDNVDEFYWDTNGTGWRQTFGRVSARLVLHDDLGGALSGEAAAYRGREGSTERTPVERTSDGFSVQATDVGRAENVTLAVGFDAGTFSPRPDGFFDSPLPPIAFFGLLLTLIAAVCATVTRATRLRHARGRATIIAEYAPPPASLAVSAALLGKTAKLAPAMILRLAVAGNMRIVDKRGGQKPMFYLQFVRSDGADEADMAFLHAVFGTRLVSGEERNLIITNASSSKLIAAFTTSAKGAARSGGYLAPRPTGMITGTAVLAVVGIVVAILFSILSLVEVYGGALPVVSLVGAILAGVATAFLLANEPRTELGSETRDHLLGLREYIALAEEDRIRVLQSPRGAERVDTSDRTGVVKLYEKLLPYAVLFGLENQWAEELSRIYAQTDAAPAWFLGPAAFDASTFASGIGSFSAESASSFSSTSGGSSGSSGSSGGGFSGGGGGGGGGGGV
jgi:uncharacterized membrane protein YgcG